MVMCTNTRAAGCDNHANIHCQLREGQQGGTNNYHDSLTSWGTVLEKLQAKKFPTLDGTIRFITVFTTAHHLALS
jgi:hypothetical protein